MSYNPLPLPYSFTPTLTVRLSSRPKPSPVKGEGNIKVIVKPLGMVIAFEVEEIG